MHSSWHGTRVSSLIAALTNNAEGVAGTGWNTLILPVRVLGKCGGTDSDIIAGMRWAAGIPVQGAPINPTPAQIINLSLGGVGRVLRRLSGSGERDHRAVACWSSSRSAMRAAPSPSPANCAGVLGVAGIRHAGTKVGFSNLGPGAGIGAPGGNCVNTQPFTARNPCLFPITAAVNTRHARRPAASTYTDHVDRTQRRHQLLGAAGRRCCGADAFPQLAIDAGAVHRAVARNCLTRSRRAAPRRRTSVTCRRAICSAEECICTTQTCGAGMLNTQAAVLAAQRPFAIA